jgi:hypothetical protein
MSFPCIIDNFIIIIITISIISSSTQLSGGEVSPFVIKNPDTNTLQYILSGDTINNIITPKKYIYITDDDDVKKPITDKKIQLIDSQSDITFNYWCNGEVISYKQQHLFVYNTTICYLDYYYKAFAQCTHFSYAVCYCTRQRTRQLGPKEITIKKPVLALYKHSHDQYNHCHEYLDDDHQDQVLLFDLENYFFSEKDNIQLACQDGSLLIYINGVLYSSCEEVNKESYYSNESFLLQLPILVQNNDLQEYQKKKVPIKIQKNKSKKQLLNCYSKAIKNIKRLRSYCVRPKEKVDNSRSRNHRIYRNCFLLFCCLYSTYRMLMYVFT